MSGGCREGPEHRCHREDGHAPDHRQSREGSQAAGRPDYQRARLRPKVPDQRSEHGLGVPFSARQRRTHGAADQPDRGGGRSASRRQTSRSDEGSRHLPFVPPQLRPAVEEGARKHREPGRQALIFDHQFDALKTMSSLLYCARNAAREL